MNILIVFTFNLYKIIAPKWYNKRYSQKNSMYTLSTIIGLQFKKGGKMRDFERI